MRWNVPKYIREFRVSLGFFGHLLGRAGAYTVVDCFSGCLAVVIDGTRVGSSVLLLRIES